MTEKGKAKQIQHMYARYPAKKSQTLEENIQFYIQENILR